MDVRIRRQPQDELAEDLFDAWWQDTRNRFAREGGVSLDDVSGDKRDDFRFYQRIEVEAREDFSDTFERSFSGIVVETHDKEDQGADVLEADLYSYDYLLRTDQIDLDVSGMGIAEALEAIIDLSPVFWNASNVEVEDEQELDRVYEGEKIDSAIGELASLSGGEIYGVNNDLEFFFAAPEPETSGESITNADWLEYDFPEKDKESVNEVTVYYGPDGEGGKVTVDDAPDKKTREDRLGSDGPPTNYIEREFEDITDPNTAEAKAKEIRDKFSRLLIGDVTTWKPLLDVDPGDTIDIAIDPINIDDEFQIASIERNFGRSESELVVVANVGDDEELLSELTDRVDQIEASRSDRDVPEDRITDTTIGALVDPTVTVGGLEADRATFTNTARNLVRDGWRGDGALDITHIAVGDDNSNLSRTNTALENETDSATVSESLDGDFAVEYDAGIGGTSTREIGLFDTDDNLLVRATLEDGIPDPPDLNTLTVDEGTTHTVDEGATETYDSVEVSGTLENSGTIQTAATVIETEIRLSVANDDEVLLGVLTETGQTTIRDILADNSPDLPQFYAYGSGDATPSESDTALETELARQDLDEIPVQVASTTAQFEAITDPADTDPARVDSDQFEHLQECFHLDARLDSTDDNRSVANDASYTDGQAALLSVTDNFVEYEITPEYDIDDVQIQLREEALTSDDITITWALNGEQIAQYTTNDAIASDIGWRDKGDYVTPLSGVSLPEGETATFRIDVDSTSGGQYAIDRVAVYDRSYESDLTFDNTVDGNDQLSGPEFFANSIEQTIETVGTRRDVTQADVDSTWNDTSNSQWIEVAIIDDDFTRTDNSETASVSVSDANADTSIQSQVSLSRFGTSSSDTPSTGRQGQAIEEWMLTANPSALNPSGIGAIEVRAVFPSGGDLSGDILREAGQLTSGGTTLTRSIYSSIPDSGTLPSTTTIIASEITTIGQQ